MITLHYEAWSRRVIAWAIGVALVLPSLACSTDGDGWPDLRGTTLEVVAVWEEAEEAAFERVLEAFEARTGATVRFTSTGGQDIGALLDARLVEGRPPDVAILPQPGLLTRYAREGAIHPVGGDVEQEVEKRYGSQWRRLATVDGELYGVWVKAANKSLVWYSIAAFERAGIVPPEDLHGLLDVAAALEASGTPPFSLAAAPSDAWTITDVFENLYLRVAGPERYDALAEHRLPWTDGTVQTTLDLLARLLRPDFLAGGSAGALMTTFPDAAAAVFSSEPRAAMVAEGDFVPGVVAGSTRAEVGIDVDVFPFPERRTGGRLVVGGGDAAVLMQRSHAGAELLRFLASAEAGEAWAALGGFVSPNEDVDLAAYPDDVTRRIARSLLEAGDDVRFDLSDLQPVEFGGTTGRGMWSLLRDFVAVPGDVPGTAARLEAAATEAWKDG
ncbi:MAG TPA: ABC transporter substrate-binding protein [Acidimicrobiales bacterium]|nr:ABC transporter substrate-binding protein [Acidimicrobiales bacterium]